MRIDDLTLVPPEGWEAQTNVMLREPASRPGAFRLNIQVGSRPAGPSLSLQVVGMTQAKLLARDLAGAAILEQGLDELEGRAYFRLAYGLTIDDTPMVQRQIFSAVGERLVTLTGTAPRDRDEELRERMLHLLTSLTPAGG